MKFKIRNPKQIQNLKPKTLNLETWNLKLGTWNAREAR